MNKIRPFREEPTLWNKIGVAAAYIILGWILAESSLGGIGDLLTKLMILGILAWAFLIRKRNVKYYVRYHLIQSLLLVMSLAAILWLLQALLGLLSTLPGLNLISAFIVNLLFTPMTMLGVMSASIEEAFVLILSIFMAIYAVRGRYVEIPWITDVVRSWL